MYGVVTAEIVLPAIMITATAIVAALLAWLDKKEAEKCTEEVADLAYRRWRKIRRLESQVTELEERNAWLEKLTTKEESSLLETRRKRIKEAPAGDERSPQSESSSWQVQSYYASHPSQTGKNPQEIDFGKKEWWHLNAR